MQGLAGGGKAPPRGLGVTHHPTVCATAQNVAPCRLCVPSPRPPTPHPPLDIGMVRVPAVPLDVGKSHVSHSIFRMNGPRPAPSPPSPPSPRGLRCRPGGGSAAASAGLQGAGAGGEGQARRPRAQRKDGGGGREGEEVGREKGKEVGSAGVGVTFMSK